MITPEQMDADAKLCNQATPGPWELNHWRIFQRAVAFVVCHLATNNSSRTEKSRHNGIFISRARTALPDYIAECRRLAAEVERMRKVIDTASAYEANAYPYSIRELMRKET